MNNKKAEACLEGVKRRLDDLDAQIALVMRDVNILLKQAKKELEEDDRAT